MSAVILRELCNYHSTAIGQLHAAVGYVPYKYPVFKFAVHAMDLRGRIDSLLNYY